MADERRISITFDVNGEQLQELDKAIKTIENFNRSISNLQKASGAITNAYEKMGNASGKMSQKQQDLLNLMRKIDGALSNHHMTINSLQQAEAELSKRLEVFGRNINLRIKETGEFSATMKDFQNQTIKLKGVFDASTGAISNFSKEVKVANDYVDRMNKKIKEAELEAERMRGLDISNRLPSGRVWDVQKDALISYGKVIQGSIDRNNKFTQTIVTQAGEVHKITGYYNRAKRALVQYNDEVSKASKSQLSRAGFDNSAIRKIGMMADSMKGLNKYTLSWNEAMAISAVRMVQWSASATLIFGTKRALTEMLSLIIEVDTQMTELKKVMNSDTNFDEMLQNSIDLANQLGRTITDINNSFIEFGRQGLDEHQIELMARATTLLANVGDIDAQTAATKLTGIITVFKKEYLEATDIVDRLNNVQNNYATTVQILTDSIGRAGGTAQAFGVSLEDLIGQTTAIGEATRESGSVIGNALKTIYSRITTLPPAYRSLEEVGVEVFDKTTGQVRQVSDILDDLHGQWDKLTDSQKQNIAIQVAGRYQVSRFLALMDNYQTAINASKTATNSWGSAVKENQTYMQSLQAKINKFVAALQELAITLGKSGIANAFAHIIDLATTFVHGITKIVDVLGPFSFTIPVVTGLLAAFGFQFKNLSQNTEILKAGLVSVSPAVTSFGMKLGLTTSQSVILSGALTKVATGIKAIAAATIGNPLFWIPMAISGIVTLIGHFQELERREQELTKTTKTAKEEYQDFLNKINSGTVETYDIEKYKKQIQELSEQQKNLNKIIKDNQNTMAYTATGYMAFNHSVSTVITSQKLLNEQYANTTKAMSVLSDQEEDMIAQMGIKIDRNTTIKDLQQEINKKQQEYSEAIKNAQKAMDDARLKSIVPTADAYYKLADSIDENVSALENALGLPKKFIDSLKEQLGIFEILSGVKNRTATQDQILNQAEQTLMETFGLTREELEKHPEAVRKRIDSYQKMYETAQKVVEGEASNQEKLRLQEQLTTENIKKYQKQQSDTIKRAHERKVKAILDEQEKTASASKSIQSSLDSEGKKHIGVASIAKQKAYDRIKSIISVEGASKRAATREIEYMNNTGMAWQSVATKTKKSGNTMQSSAKTTKDKTTSYLSSIITKIGKLTDGWEDLGRLFSHPLEGLVKLSIKAIFGGLFGSGGKIDGDKLKDSIMKAGGTPISGRGFGGLILTSGFGKRRHPISGKTSFHAGIDLAGPMGTPIRAREGGFVQYAGWMNGYGNIVIIRGLNGLEYRYGHNSKLKVSTGQFVPSGAVISLLGSTGDSTGPHLHFEVRRNGEAINPMPYYHSGGIVDGKKRPNEVDARLQVGEMVITKQQQKALFDFLNKKNGNDVFTGMGGPTKNYKIKWGDTLSELAVKFHTTVAELMRLNPKIKNKNLIYAGDTIKVPASSSSSTKSSSSKKSSSSSHNTDYYNKKAQSIFDYMSYMKDIGSSAYDAPSYDVWKMITNRSTFAHAGSEQQKEYNKTVVEALKQYEDLNAAYKKLNEAKLFGLTKQQLDDIRKGIKEAVSQNVLQKETEAVDKWLDNFNKKVKDANDNVQSMLSLIDQVNERKAQEKQDAFVNNYVNDLLGQLGINTNQSNDPLEALKQQADDLLQKIQDRAKESANLQYLLNSGDLQARLTELANYRKQLQDQINAVANDFKKRGITDSSLISQAQQPLKDRLAEITEEYNKLQDALANGTKTIADNKAELEQLAQQYKELQEQINAYNNRREFTDAWGNVVRNAEGQVQMITAQGQRIVDTFNQINQAMSYSDTMKKMPALQTVDTSISTSTGETKTYEANTNVTRNVTYIVQAGVTVASETELREFAKILKQMMDEEEGRDKS